MITYKKLGQKVKKDICFKKRLRFSNNLTPFSTQQMLVFQKFYKLSGREESTASPKSKNLSDVPIKNDKDCAANFTVNFSSIGVERQKSVKPLSHGTFTARTPNNDRSIYLHDCTAEEFHFLTKKQLFLRKFQKKN